MDRLVIDVQTGVTNVVLLTPEEIAALPQPSTPPIPTVVNMCQARLALLQSGLLFAVQSAIDSLPGEAGDAARIEWEFRSTVDRNSPLVQALSASLSLSDAQLNELFMLASTL